MATKKRTTQLAKQRTALDKASRAATVALDRAEDALLARSARLARRQAEAGSRVSETFPASVQGR